MIVHPADRLNQVQEYYFSKKLEQIARMRGQGLDVINLGIGNPDLVPPEAALNAAITSIRKPNSHGYSSYRSTPELRAAMASWYQKAYGVSLNPQSEILPLLGSKEGILYLSMALLNPGDAVLVPNPGYPAYASVAKLLNANVIYYDLKDENSWLPDLEQLSKLDLSRCKLMWINYPHMPTGQTCTLDFFKKLVQFAKSKKIFLCNDNPYGLILNSESPLSLLKADPNKEVSGELNSLSKSFNMAGWRVGMFLGAQDVVDAVLQVKSNVDSGMFSAVQSGAMEALAVDQTWHTQRNEVYSERRKLVWELFDLLKFNYAPDQVGLFVWAKAPNEVRVVSEYLDQILEQAQVFITPGMIFGSNGDRYARSSLCSPEPLLKSAIERIRKFTQGSVHGATR